MKNEVKKIKSIADPVRIRILKVLLLSKTELCVCEIVDTLKIPFYTISRHIKEMKNAGILEETREGKFILYTISKPGDSFASKLLALIQAVPEEDFEKDKQLLKKRLSLRENGKCVVGMKSAAKKAKK
jgi:ArsR family transcriptional regulator, arsenate/arsenite/antimonite-responsive transcriptional repressor